MSNKRLIIISSLLAFCLCNPYEKKSCIRPAVFKDVGEVADYVKCIKTITGSPPYGKRSLPPQSSSPFFHKLHPALRDLDPDYLEALVYHVLKAERDMQA